MSVRTTQPQGAVRLVGRSSLAGAAVFCANSNPRTGARLASASIATRAGKAANVVLPGATTIGIGVPVTPSWSLLMVIRRDAEFLYPYFLGISGAANPIALTGKHDSIGDRVGWYDGGTLRDSGFLLPVGETAVMGLTYEGATGRYSWFKNGQSFNTTVGANTGSGSWQFATAGAEPITNALPLLVIAPRAIPANEMRSLTGNPWQIFEAPQPIYLYKAASGGGASGSLSATLGSASASSAGTVALAGSLARTLGVATVASAGATSIAGALSKTLGALSASSAGAVEISGASAATLAPATLSASGTVSNGGVNGVLSSTLSAVTAVSSGTTAISGSAPITLGAVALASGGTLSVIGALSQTLGSLTLSASDAEPAIPAVGGGGSGGTVRDVRNFADLLDKARPTKTAKKRLRRVLEAEALELLPDGPQAAKAASIIAQVVAKKEIQAIERRPVDAAPLAALPFDPSEEIARMVAEWLENDAIQRELEDEYEVELLLMG